MRVFIRNYQKSERTFSANLLEQPALQSVLPAAEISAAALQSTELEPAVQPAALQPAAVQPAKPTSPAIPRQRLEWERLQRPELLSSAGIVLGLPRTVISEPVPRLLQPEISSAILQQPAVLQYESISL